MKRSLIFLCITAGSMVMLSGCGSIQQSIHNKLGNAQLKQKQLADGNTVYVDMDVQPPASWNCQQVGAPHAYNWQLLKAEGITNPISGGYGILMDEAIDYANKNNIKTNFIALHVPNEMSLQAGGGGSVTNSFVLNPAAKATATYYQCQSIDPNAKFG